MNYGIGIDIGGTKCAIVIGNMELIDYDSEFIIEKRKFDTKKYITPDRVISKIIQIIEDIILNNGFSLKDCLGIGISCGGPLNSKSGVILNPPNLPGWTRVPIKEILEKHFNVSAILENDANACAVAEWKYGAGKGLKNVVFMTFGTGLGAGLILDGNLYRGTNEMAGEIGHIRLTEVGPVGYGKMGSFEGFCSGGGIEQIANMMVLEKIEQGEKPNLLNNMEQLTAENVAVAAKEGDELAKEIYATSGRYLGRGLSVIIDILNPEAIIIGSIYERSGDLLWPSAEKVIKKESLSIANEVCSVLPSKLGDSIGDYSSLALVTYENWRKFNE